MGSKDMTTWIFGAERWANLIYYSVGGHKDIIMGCFFEKDSLDVSSQCLLCVLQNVDAPVTVINYPVARFCHFVVAVDGPAVSSQQIQQHQL